MTTSFANFISLSLPTAVAFLISSNLLKVVGALQSSVINPSLGLIPGIGENIDQLNFVVKENPKITIFYGQVISALISFVIICLLVWVLVIIAEKYTKLDLTKKL